MGRAVRIVIAGEGAIASRHASALAQIEDVEVVGLVGADPEATEAFARRFRIADWSLDLDHYLSSSDVDALVLATPTPLHATQAIRALEAGKHVLIEIPMADSLLGATSIVAAAAAAERKAMVCHTRRFNPSHQWIHRRVQSGALTLQHLIVNTVFFRRENLNALGQRREWTDHLLWHHACHTIDLFIHQTGGTPEASFILEGPRHAELDIAMDMSIGMASKDGALCTLALSFNHEGPFGTTFRYVCDNGTYIAEYDDLRTADGRAIDLSDIDPVTDGIELQDREFVAAILEDREPKSSVAACLPSMETIDGLERMLAERI